MTAKKQTNRQKEAQKLWQERGLLERTNANLRTVYKLACSSGLYNTATQIEEAGRTIRALIKLNIVSMATIKERISNE